MAHQPIHIEWEQRHHYFDKAVHYFMLLEKNMTPEGFVPEMYVGEQTGHNTPLAWAQSFHVVAAQMLVNLASSHSEHFKIPTDCTRRFQAKATFAFSGVA